MTDAELVAELRIALAAQYLMWKSPLFAEVVKQPYATLTDSGRVRFPTAFDAAHALSAALLAAAGGAWLGRRAAGNF
jgi:hypothetical protein